jgi:hypothetical protein
LHASAAAERNAGPWGACFALGVRQTRGRCQTAAVACRAMVAKKEAFRSLSWARASVGAVAVQAGARPGVQAYGAGAGPGAGAGALVVFQPQAQVVVARRRNSVAREAREAREEAIRLLDMFINSLEQIQREIYLDPILIGANYFRSIQAFNEGLRTIAASYAAGYAAYVGAVALIPRQNLEGGATIFCKGLSHLLSSIYTIVILLILAAILSQFLDYIDHREIKPNLVDDFLYRICNLSEIKITVMQICLSIFDNLIFNKLVASIRKLLGIFLKLAFIKMLLHNVSFIQMLSAVAGAAAVSATKTAISEGPKAAAQEAISQVISIFTFIVDMCKRLLNGLYYGVNVIPCSVYKMYTFIYNLVLDLCGKLPNFNEKEIVHIANLGIQVLAENTPNKQVSAPAAYIKEENKIIVARNVVLDKTKLRIDPKLYRKLQQSKLSRSRPSRKRTPSRSLRKRSSSRKRTTSPSRRAQSKKRGSRRR